MSFNPIDIVRTQEASQIRHMESQRAQHLQDQGIQNFQNLVRKEISKPKETVKTENNEYRYDAKEKGNNEYYSSEENKKKKKEKK